MGFVHHANYFRYLELCRTEMLRAAGGCYRDVEEAGEFVVVVKAEIAYKTPARYDDLLNVHLEITNIGQAKAVHNYTITRGRETIATSELTLAVVNREGKLIPIPDWMREKLVSR